jgi:CO/xanthine dehydrogenase Mo-binding subunit
VDPEAALAPGAPLVHDALPGNEAGWFSVKVGDAAAAIAHAPHVIKRRITHHRYAAMPIECRGAVGAPVRYDSGDYPKALAMALDKLGGVEAFRRRQAAARQEGRRLGPGIGCYTEGTGIGPFEGAKVAIDPDGKVHVVSGVAAQGQGMETVFSQLAADAWKVKPEDVVITLGDTAAIPRGLGTIASRVTVTASAAVGASTVPCRKRFTMTARASSSPARCWTTRCPPPRCVPTSRSPTSRALRRSIPSA